jgi:hypothetical protein
MEKLQNFSGTRAATCRQILAADLSFFAARFNSGKKLQW